MYVHGLQGEIRGLSCDAINMRRAITEGRCNPGQMQSFIMCVITDVDDITEL